MESVHGIFYFVIIIHVIVFLYFTKHIVCENTATISKNSISVHYAHTHIKNYTITHVLSIYKHNYYYEPPRRLLMTITQCNKRDLKKSGIMQQYSWSQGK